MEENKAQKVAFFTDLYQLDEIDEDSGHTKDSVAESFQQVINGHLSYTTPASLPSADAKSASLTKSTVHVPKSTENLVSNYPAITAEPRSSRITKPSMKNARKRKRQETLEVLPEDQQIFRDLKFYFFPDSDISPVRRLRIKKARERGAVWVKDWAADVTHVIFDRGLTYNDLLKYLKISNVPANVILVTEDYPADCIAYQLVLNHDQAQYYPEGYQGLKKNKPIPALESSTAVQPHQEPNREGNSLQPPEFGSLKNFEHFLVKKCSSNNLIRISETIGSSRNALDEAIEEVKAVENLPLDLDENSNEIERNESQDKEETQSESEARKKVSKKYSNATWQQNFSCMQKNDGLQQSENPNHRTIEVLQAMLDYYNRTGDQWRAIAYRKAITALRKQPCKIMTKDEAFRIPNIGNRLAAKIEEIVQTDRLRRLENAELEPNDRTLQMFMKIYGVGFTQATSWINQGHRTLEDLVENAHLTRNQLIGIEHYHDFLVRIPRDEVEHHGTIVRSAVQAVDEDIQVILGGSYRRGAADSGDVDFIVTKPNCDVGSLRQLIVDTVIPQLQQNGYLKAGLSVASKAHGSKWHGAAVLPGSPIWRRVDFLLVPWEEMGAALIYFTGNDIFNRSIRLLASKKGMRLNQRGLWAGVMRGRGRQRVTQGTLVESKSEERIFEILGVPYRPPEHRIC